MQGKLNMYLRQIYTEVWPLLDEAYNLVYMTITHMITSAVEKCAILPE